MLWCMTSSGLNLDCSNNLQLAPTIPLKPFLTVVSFSQCFLILSKLIANCNCSIFYQLKRKATSLKLIFAWKLTKKVVIQANLGRSWSRDSQKKEAEYWCLGIIFAIKGVIVLILCCMLLQKSVATLQCVLTYRRTSYTTSGCRRSTRRFLHRHA